MSLFASIVKTGFADIDESVNSTLAEVRQKDKITRNLINQQVKEETALLEHLTLIIKQHPEFDEEPFEILAKGLIARRAILVQMIEDQMKSTQTVYDYLDGKMAHFDTCVKRMAPNVQGLGSDNIADVHKKKKRKAGQEMSSLETEKQLFEQLISVAIVDPSEPLYCFCRRISCGEMVGCDNEDCALEWFHYSCVGISLSQEVPESWYCQDCASSSQTTV